MCLAVNFILSKSGACNPIDIRGALSDKPNLLDVSFVSLNVISNILVFHPCHRSTGSPISNLYDGSSGVRALTSWGLRDSNEIGPEFRRHTKAIEKIRIPQSNIPNISKNILTNLRIIQMFPIIPIMELPHG